VGGLGVFVAFPLALPPGRHQHLNNVAHRAYAFVCGAEVPSSCKTRSALIEQLQQKQVTGQGVQDMLPGPHRLGAKVTGYALTPPTDPSLFELARVRELVTSYEADVRDFPRLVTCLRESRAEMVIHMAAQSLVRESYKGPLETYEVNVMGTANVLQAVRDVGGVKAVLVVTSDKCYENKEWCWGYRESDPMGGHDPYSSSKGWTRT